ncbi:EamA family transporter [Phaeospirillum tilakii]|uniref:EamA family transporter n=1 Tax=Phaeospirillum tilakii TaxID=741673 RepID=A0ABW5C7T6_9PROT
MSATLPILFALIAALGNALFAYGQKASAGSGNGLLFVAASALVATLLALAAAPLLGRFDPLAVWRDDGPAVLIGGFGLFLTYLGFNLLYSRFGATPYALYAVLSILTTTVGVGLLILREPVTPWHLGAVAAALVSVVLFSLGQARS